MRAAKSILAIATIAVLAAGGWTVLQPPLVKLSGPAESTGDLLADLARTQCPLQLELTAGPRGSRRAAVLEGGVMEWTNGGTHHTRELSEEWIADAFGTTRLRVGESASASVFFTGVLPAPVTVRIRYRPRADELRTVQHTISCSLTGADSVRRDSAFWAALREIRDR